MSDSTNELRTCSRCKSTILLKYFEINRKGQLYKLCNNCRNNKQVKDDKPIKEVKPYVKPEVIILEDGFRSLAEHLDLEVNALGEVRFKRSKKQPSGLKYGDKYDSWYIIFFTDGLGGDCKQISLFNLVAKCFIDNPNGYKFVQAKNGNNSNYKASNLEWVKSRRRKTKDDDIDY